MSAHILVHRRWYEKQIGLNPSDWTNNTDDNTNGSTIYGDWIWDNLGTGSVNTGPNYSTNYLGTGYTYDGKATTCT